MSTLSSPYSSSTSARPNHFLSHFHWIFQDHFNYINTISKTHCYSIKHIIIALQFQLRLAYWLVSLLATESARVRGSPWAKIFRSYFFFKLIHFNSITLNQTPKNHVLFFRHNYDIDNMNIKQFKWFKWPLATFPLSIL